MTEQITPQAEKVRRAWRVAESDYKPIVRRSEECMRYVLNDPYTATEKSKAQEFDKPLLKYTIMIPYLSTIIGNEQMNRRRALIKTRSLDPKMVEMTDILQGRWNAINDEQSVEEKIQIIFSDALIFPVGGYMVRSFEMNEMGYLDFHYEIADNMRIKLDPETKTSDYKLEKCRWLIKEAWERPEYIMDRWNVKQEDFDDYKKGEWWKKLSGYIKRFKESGFSGSSDYNEENDLYRILEMQERVQKRFVRVFNGTGVMQIPQEMYKRLKPNNPDLEYLGEVEGEIIHTTTIIPALNDLLVSDDDSEVPTKNFDVMRLGSYSFTNQVIEAVSLVELLMDIQDDINKGKSQNRDYLSQMLAEIIVVHGKQEKEVYEELQRVGNQPGKVVQTKNPNTKIDKLGPGQINPALLGNTIDSLMHGDKVAQMPAAIRGESERSGESGILFQKKSERAAAAINPYYKNISNFRKQIVEDYVDNFHYVYSEMDRMIDVKGKDENGKDLFGQVFVNLQMADEIINDTKNLSMYVELDEGEDNITAREENFNQLMALAEVIGSHNPALVDVLTLLRAAPVKGADKWIEYVIEVMNSQAKEGEAQKLMEEEKARVDIAKTASEIQPNQNVAQT